MENNNLTIISIDMNGLKDINDEFGHQAGDRALQHLGNAILENQRKHFSAYRVGGDEFMVLVKNETLDNINTYMKNICSNIVDFKITISYGYENYKPGDDFEEVCHKADKLMYQDKQNYKHRKTLEKEKK